MPKFTDAKGREWDVTINVAVLKRVKGATGHLLTDALTPTSETFRLIREDVLFFPDLLFRIIEPQAKATGVSDEQFAEGLLGDPFAAAYDAFAEAVVDFFQNPQQREISRALLGKAKAAMNLMTSRAMAEVDKVTPDQMAAATEAEMLASSKPATTPPAGSA